MNKKPAGEIHDFWNSRVEKGEHAGTDDFLLKRLELREIRSRVPPGSTVLDIGCGNGETLLSLASEKEVSGVGIDYAEELVSYANDMAVARGFSDNVSFQVGQIQSLSDDLGDFPVVISERCIINLSDPAEQKLAFDNIRNRVAQGGIFLMFENAIQGLDETNSLREKLGLERMIPPWHNLYLDADEVAGWGTEDFVLEEFVHFSSTYHLLSRVLYAKVAMDSGEELRYDSPINLVSCELPVLGTFGPTKLWVWRKRSV